MFCFLNFTLLKCMKEKENCYFENLIKSLKRTTSIEGLKDLLTNNTDLLTNNTKILKAEDFRKLLKVVLFQQNTFLNFEKQKLLKEFKENLPTLDKYIDEENVYFFFF